MGRKKIFTDEELQERKKIQSKNFREKNRGKIKIEMQEYYQNNKEKWNIYYINNKDQRLEYIKNNKEKINKQKRESDKRNYHKDPNNPIKNRKKALKRNYNLTVDQYDEILNSQNGGCAICKKKEISKDKNGIIKSLAVDHDHETGEIRGLLCQKHNQGLGFFQDSIEMLENAIKYLKLRDGDKCLGCPTP